MLKKIEINFVKPDTGEILFHQQKLCQISYPDDSQEFINKMLGLYYRGVEKYGELTLQINSFNYKAPLQNQIF